jgi:hypothetical protein
VTGRAGWRGDVAVGLALLAIGARSWTRAAAGPAVIDVLPREVALGSLPEGEERVVRLVVRNGGDRPAEVKVLPSCTCMAVDPGPFALGPGAQAVVPVRVSTARKPGFNAAHVQVADASGAVVAQSRITFTAVQSFVFDPPVLFLRPGDERVAATAACLAREVPERLEAVSADPALAVTVVRAGRRTWEIAVALAGRPRARLASVRIVACRGRGRETVGELAVSVPSTRVGDVRISSVAEPVAGGARVFLLVDAESATPLRMRSLRAVSGEALSWRETPGATEAGSHLWVEVIHPRGGESREVEAVIAAGAVEERIRAPLPGVPGP